MDKYILGGVKVYLTSCCRGIDASDSFEKLGICVEFKFFTLSIGDWEYQTVVLDCSSLVRHDEVATNWLSLSSHVLTNFYLLRYIATLELINMPKTVTPANSQSKKHTDQLFNQFYSIWCTRSDTWKISWSGLS